MPARHPHLALVLEAFTVWSGRNAFMHAGALAFYTLFSLAPLVIILVTIAGAVFGEQAARGEITAQIEGFIGRQAAEAVEEAVRRSRIAEAGLLPTIAGSLGLLFGATTVFAQMQTSLNQFFGVIAKPSRSGVIVFLMSRLLSLGLVLIIGFLLLTSLAMTIAMTAVIRFAEEWIPVPPAAVAAADLALSLLVAAALFGMIFKVLPDVRLTWRRIAEGATITAVLFVVGQYLISFYLTHTAPESAYGAAGALVLVLMWVYYSTLILFFGAAIIKASIRQSGGYVVPKATAVRTQLQIIEE